MHDQPLESNLPKRSQAVRSVVFIIAAAALLTVCFFVGKLPPRLNPEQVVSQLGTYRFPTGNNSLQIAKDQSGNVSITVHRQATRLYFIPYTYSDRPFTFESERDWFVSVDKYQRLWVYRGHWGKSWGKLRQMPSGGTIPYAPAVLLDGSFFLENGKLVSGSCVVSETRYWAGVPGEFLARIHKSGTEKWRTACAIPDLPPPLTQVQEFQLAGRVKRARTIR